MRSFLKVSRVILFVITFAPALAQPIKMKWQVNVNYLYGGEVKVIPVVYKNTILFADEVGTIHCLDSETGSPRWSYNSRAATFNSKIFIHPLQRIDARNGYVTVMAGSSTLILNADNGKLIWSIPCENDRYSDAIIVNDQVITIANGEKGTVSAIDLKSGKTSWTKTLNHHLTGNIIKKDNVLLFPAYTTTLLALNAHTGELIWTAAVQVSDNRFGSYDDLFVFNNNFKKITAINIQTGVVVWEKETGSTIGDVMVSGKYVLEGGMITPDKRYIACRNLTDGSVLWRLPDSQTIMDLLTVTPDNAYVYVRRNVLEGSYVDIYDIHTGKLLHSKMFDKIDPNYAVRDGNKLFVGNSTNHGIFPCLEIDIN